MFDIVSDGFKKAKNRFQGKQAITAANIKDALRDIRQSLLEADVEFRVVKNFLKKVEEKALGEVVQTSVKYKGEKKKIKPADAFIKICQTELEALMGPVDTSINYKEKGPSLILMMGLQGSGKTTSCGKLAKMLMVEKSKRILLVAGDIYRPAAVEQLKVIGDKLDLKVFYEENTTPPDICEHALSYAKEHKYDIVILDTAGRLAIDQTLMEELKEIDKRTKPDNKFLVIDAMIGQDAVHTAREFNSQLEIDGIILTKLDGDARGGAALSVKEVTKKPIKFLGMGEGLDKLEVFRPEGLASRILGMGDILGLVGDFEKVVDKKAEENAMKMLSGEFNFDSFRSQLEMINKMGSVKDLMAKMPMGNMQVPDDVDESAFKKSGYMIDSMTVKERLKPSIIDESRMIRIAKGSGRTFQEVKELMMQFNTMKKMMDQLSMGNTGFLKNIPGVKQLMQLKDMKSMLSGTGMEDLFGGGGFGDMFGGGNMFQNNSKGAKKKKVRAFSSSSKKKKKLSSKAKKKKKKKK